MVARYLVVRVDGIVAALALGVRRGCLWGGGEVGDGTGRTIALLSVLSRRTACCCERYSGERALYAGKVLK